MSTDEETHRTARAHLSPGENLLWAGRTSPKYTARNGLRVAAITFLFFLSFGAFAAAGVWHVDQESAQFWATHPHPGVAAPASGISFLVPLTFFGGFGLLAGATFAAFYRSVAKPTTYAITDRRLLFLSTANGTSVAVAAYGPEEILFVRRQDHRDGTSDLFIRPSAEEGGGMLDISGIAVPFRLHVTDVGLRSIADAGAAEALIGALQAGKLAGTVPVSTKPSSEAPDEGEIVFKKFTTPWKVGVPFVLGGLPFLGIGIAAGLGLTALHSGEGASATPVSPLAGLLSFGGVGLFCIVTGACLILWRDGFKADPITRTYRMQRGFSPFARPISGPFTDFDGVRLTREDSTDAESADKIFWRVSLLWNAKGRKPYDLLVTPFAPHGAEEARRFAAALGLPQEDLSAEPTPVERKTQAERADPVVQARLARKKRGKVRGWIAAGVLLALLTVNSLLKGVVFVARWTDASGFSVVQQSTGFWTQTIGTSAGKGSWTTTKTTMDSAESMSLPHGSLGDLSRDGEKKDYRWSLLLGSRLAEEDRQTAARAR